MFWKVDIVSLFRSIILHPFQSNQASPRSLPFSLVKYRLRIKLSYEHSIVH